MAHETQVIKYLKKKQNDDLDHSPITWLGSKPCFISPIRNSSLNNLEEQLILGTDNYLATYEDNDGNTHIEQSFCTVNLEKEDSTDYYRMESIIYATPEMYGDVVFSKDGVEFAQNLNVIFGDPTRIPYTDVNSVYFINDRFTFDESNNLIISDPLGGYIKTREDKLYFIKEGQQPALILTKTTGTKNLAGTIVNYSRVENELTKQRTEGE